MTKTIKVLKNSFSIILLIFRFNILNYFKKILKNNKKNTFPLTSLIYFSKLFSFKLWKIFSKALKLKEFFKISSPDQMYETNFSA